MPATYYLITVVTQQVFKSGSVNPPTLLFFKVVLAILSPLSFHANFGIFSISAKMPNGMLIRITLIL